jgi:hypothetical protein
MRAIGGLLLSTATLAPAQCVMCRTAAAAQAHAAGTINAAILILLVPALALFSGVSLLVLRCPPPPDPDTIGSSGNSEDGGAHDNDAARSHD